jgi:hypothetical protein
LGAGSNKIERFHAALHSIGDIFLDNLPDLPSEDLRDHIKYFYQQFFRLYRTTEMTFYSALKHPAYRDEKEFRLLLHTKIESNDIIQFRPRGYDLVPYLELGWKEHYADALKEIIIGPSADKEKAKNFIQSCLNQSGIRHKVRISYSDIPYRSF